MSTPNPPVVEVVISAQFSRLTKLTSGHVGWFWKELGEEWKGHPRDLPPIQDQFERFDEPSGVSPDPFMLRLGRPGGLPRFMSSNAAGDRVLQIQPTRLLLNWRGQPNDYPTYGRLISEFEGIFSRFSKFIETAGIGPIVINQWELTYVDVFLKDDLWQTPADWSKFLPGLFSSLSVAEGLNLEHRAAEWRYEIIPKKGRIHIAARLGRSPEGKDALIMRMTARGPVGEGGARSLRDGLDRGHQVAHDTFFRVVSDAVKQRCEVAR